MRGCRIKNARIKNGLYIGIICFSKNDRMLCLLSDSEKIAATTSDQRTRGCLLAFIPLIVLILACVPRMNSWKNMWRTATWQIIGNSSQRSHVSPHVYPHYQALFTVWLSCSGRCWIFGLMRRH